MTGYARPVTTFDPRAWWFVLMAMTGCSSATTPAASHDAGERTDAASDALVSFDGGHAPTPDATTPLDAAHDAATVADAQPATDASDASSPLDAVVSPPDGPPMNPVLALGACVGTSKALTVSDQMPYVAVAVGSDSGEFVLDYGSTFSSVDLAAFAAPGPTTSGCDASLLGSICTVDAFAFFGPPSSVILTTEDYADVSGSVRQAGIIGTDFLSEQVFTLDYAGGNAYAAPQASACSSAALTAAGFVALSTTGFFENDLALLEPFTDVDGQASSGESVPNVPTVPVSVAGVSAVAQLDTGFDDAVTPFSVNVNKAFYTAITGAHPGALVRDAAMDETLTTCVDGVSESVEAYQLAPGTTFDFMGASATAARTYAHAVLFVKSAPAAASSCGGIGTWTVPAAQVGASFYVDLKSLVFDPFGAVVWVPRP
jgi:hypothetical protein